MLDESKNVDLLVDETIAPTIIKTDVGAVDGQNKCPKCGASDVALNTATGKLRCNFCRYEFESEHFSDMESDISKLDKEIISSGVSDIDDSYNDMITLKCTSCGAEVVVDTAESGQARCHWCRNILSINQQIPNGTVPDVLLPFNLKKDDARSLINAFVGKRKFFAHPQFTKEFTSENIMGVYFPYMVVDINSHSRFSGYGEIETGSYYVGSSKDREVRYNADLYEVEREFDLTIKGLTVESNLNRLDKKSKSKTNNIINSIMPFDIQNCVKYNATYLRGFSSERRDINVEELKGVVETQSKDIARFAANETLGQYDRGVCWENEEFDIKGQQWKGAYLPVWLYSYQQKNGILHYIAVNARTKETMGSVPIHMPKLLFSCLIVELMAALGMIVVDYDKDYLFLSAGVLLYIFIYFRYRNPAARHSYEDETEKNTRNLRSEDNYIKGRTGLRSSSIQGKNNEAIKGENLITNFLKNNK